MLKFPELEEIEALIPAAQKLGRVSVLAEVSTGDHKFPIHAFSFGNLGGCVPAFGLFAGVHGLERIGTRVVIAYLTRLLSQLPWDRSLRTLLDESALHFIPLINPTGMLRETRSNGNGVDLMRNAPVQAENLSRFRLYAGHYLSPRLPWYRGTGELEPEAKAVCQFVEQHLMSAPVSLSLDVHSGYGIVDRVWFPYARTVEAPAHLPEILSLTKLFAQTNPNHIYVIEPQSKEYLTHGDIWDYLYDRQIANNPNRLFIPFCLEMGSWNWVKKNPRQLLSLLGAFNPLLPHRQSRTLRRHVLLFDFFHRAVLSSEAWAKLPSEQRTSLEEEARATWYGKSKQ